MPEAPLPAMRRGPARWISVLAALGRVALMNAAAYRASFVVDVLVGAVASVGVVLPLLFVYEHAGSVAGWTLHQALLVTAFFLVLQGLVGLLVEPNLGAVVEGVRSGSLDYLVLKPVDAQLVASLQRVAPAKAWDVLAGLVVGAWALAHLPPPTWQGALLALGLLLAGLAAIYGVWVLVICTSFWFVRVDNLRFLLTAALDAGRWPVGVYRGWVRLLLTVVVPVALVTSFPAMALLGTARPGTVLHALVVAGGLLWASRLTWRGALRHYTSASS
ncbi:ABC-2 family transporter protein [Myxococcota bacterium]|nr:ABC-2 family transporter protein [Myxococcota bacterium]